MLAATGMTEGHRSAKIVNRLTNRVYDPPRARVNPRLATSVMEVFKKMRRKLIAPVIALLAALTLLTGCFGGQDLQSVSDAGGLFHVRVPDDWQANAQPQVLILYGDDKLPGSEQEAFEQLSIGMFVASQASSDPVGPKLTALMDARAKGRGWKSKQVSKPAEISIGGRPGFALDVSGTDAQGREFAGRAALVRTGGSEVLVFAVAPQDTWDKRADEVETLFTEWYWHTGGSATEASAAVKP